MNEASGCCAAAARQEGAMRASGPARSRTSTVRPSPWPDRSRPWPGTSVDVVGRRVTSRARTRGSGRPRRCARLTTSRVERPSGESTTSSATACRSSPACTVERVGARCASRCVGAGAAASGRPGRRSPRGARRGRAAARRRAARGWFRPLARLPEPTRRRASRYRRRVQCVSWRASANFSRRARS